MDSTPPLSASLKELVETFDLFDLDVEGTLHGLRQAILAAVPSFAGLSMTLRVDGQDVSLIAMEPCRGSSRPGSSLRLPLSSASAAGSGSHLVLYAGTPGALVDLAADLDFALSHSEPELGVDDDLSLPLPRSGIFGVEELAMINRATGFLIGQGLTPEEARHALQRQAAQAQLAVYQIAAHLISVTE